MARKKAAAHRQKLENMTAEKRDQYNSSLEKHKEEREARRLSKHEKNALKKSTNGNKHTEKPEKRVLDLSSDSESGSEELKINGGYAKRMEFNKEREELERLEEKYKDVDIDEELDESTSEEEDDLGELVDDEIDSGIKKVLKAIRENPETLINSKEEFYRPIEKEAELAKQKLKDHEKPMHLKDYHRLNYMNEDEESGGEKPFVIQQREEREQLVKEIHNGVKEEGEDGEEDSDDDDFLTKREVQREVAPLELPDPDKNSEAFLEAFLDNKAWIPKNIDSKTGKPIIPTYSAMVSDDEEDEELEEINEQFENAYNFRFEDPDAAELVSYARNQNTLRRQKENSRKRGRDKKRQAEREREERRKAELKRLKALKVKEVTRKFELLQQALGDDGDIISRITPEQLEGEFNESEWDKKMQEVFNEEFYSKKETNPTDLQGYADSDNDNDNDNDNSIAGDDEGHEDGDREDKAEEDGEAKVLSKKKQKQLEKAKQRAERQKLVQTAEHFVEENIDLVVPDNIRETAGPKFKYRDVSPDSFGLTPRDILLADDKDLNDYVGLKNLATYRDEDKKAKDKKRYSKKKRLAEWRKAVFDTELEPSDELFAQKFASIGNGASEEGNKKKKTKHNKHNK